MKSIQTNIDKIKITDEGMKEAINDLFHKHKKGSLEKLERTFNKKLIYKAHVKNSDNPNLRLKGIEVLEQGLDHYELEESDIQEALQDYTRKHKLGNFVESYQSVCYVSDEYNGYHEYFYEVKLKRN